MQDYTRDELFQRLYKKLGWIGDKTEITTTDIDLLCAQRCRQPCSLRMHKNCPTACYGFLKYSLNTCYFANSTLVLVSKLPVSVISR